MVLPALHIAADAEALSPYEDTSRAYRAMRGKRTGGQRVVSLLFVPNEGTHDRSLPCADLRLTDTAKDGREIIMEFSEMTVVIAGRNLKMVGDSLSAGWVASVEAFDPRLRDAPAADEAVIERITFYPSARREAMRTGRGKPQVVKTS